jgi:pyrrolysine biosynthesis protein PylD
VTRLKKDDIKSIASRLIKYDHELRVKTGLNLFGIACHSYGLSEGETRARANSLCCDVVPVTAGEGVITDFSETVCAILQFLGFPARITEASDTAGIAMAFEKKTDAIFLADDYRFVGINLHTRFVADNAEATGRVYSAALDLMAGGLDGRNVLVLGCGPVGAASARALLKFGARVVLYDKFFEAAVSLKKQLETKQEVVIITEFPKEVHSYRYVIDATPSDTIMSVEQLGEDMFLAAPGVPLGISEKGSEVLGNHLIHDKLELGVAAMAVSLLC